VSEYRNKPRLVIPKEIRESVRLRFDGRCGYCGEKPNRLVIDHVEPYSYRQDNSESNLMPSCQSCNNYKNVWFIEEFRKELAAMVQKARRYSVNFRFAEKFNLIEVREGPIVFYFEKDPNHD